MPLLLSAPGSPYLSGPHSRYVTVYELQEADASFIGEQVERLRLDVGVVQSGPFQILLGQLGVCRVACILSHGLNGLGAIHGLLGAGDSGQPAEV
jgi:hypothetical protein